MDSLRAQSVLELSANLYLKYMPLDLAGFLILNFCTVLVI